MTENHSTFLIMGEATSPHARRVIEIVWKPRSLSQWQLFSTVRKVNATLWSRMVAMHALVRRFGWKWPTKKQWETWAKGRFPGLGSQQVQQTIRIFLDAVSSTKMAREKARREGVAPEDLPKYPWRSRRYRSVTYTSQDVTVEQDTLRFRHDRKTPALRVRVPEGIVLPGRITEAQIAYGVVRLVCEAGTAVAASGVTIGVDLGVNSLLAATDGSTAIVVSGREAKAIVQYRNKKLASLQARMSRCKNGSKKHKRLAQRKHRHLAKCARKIKDLCHKATRAVAKGFAGATAVVGKPFNDAARKIRRQQAQQVSSACGRVLIALLSYKLAGATSIPEPYSSQTCPVCVCRQKCRRTYHCKECGLVAPRDVVGGVNIRTIGLHGVIVPVKAMPSKIQFVRPLRKYPGSKDPGSSGGTPARSHNAV
jgi:putative transposase